MNVHSAQPAAAIDDRSEVTARPLARILVLFESTRNGVAALRAAAELIDADSHLTVVTLAPQSLPSRCCGPSVEVLNCAVRETAERELRAAREILGDAANRATFKSLVGTHDPPLAAWAAAQNFDLIVLPSRRLALGGHPFARRLRRATAAELLCVG